MCDTSDCLLYALSGRGAMRWPSFKSAFHLLRQRLSGESVQNMEDPSPRHLLLRCVRALSELAYCDFDFDDTETVYVAPPFLARLPVGGHVSAVLVGARTPSLVADVHEMARQHGLTVNERISQGTAFGVPRSVTVDAPTPEELGRFAGQLGVAYSNDPPAWHITHFASGVPDYLSTLSWLPATEPAWSECGYDPQALSFSGFCDESDELRLTRHEERGRWKFALWNNGRRANANLDWSRFAIASIRHSRLIAYDIRRCLFAVPAACPLPPPLARAIALCSGRPAIRRFLPDLVLDIEQDRRLYDFYENVPLAIAEIVAEKLGQRLIHSNIETS